MGKSNFTDEFRRDAVRQIIERGYPVSEVSKRLGVSAHLLYEWRKKYGGAIDKGDEQSEEIRRLKRELVRVTEERDILKIAAAYFARDAK
jgi:transposase